MSSLGEDLGKWNDHGSAAPRASWDARQVAIVISKNDRHLVPSNSSTAPIQRLRSAK
jgi:hypothetical protein